MKKKKFFSALLAALLLVNALCLPVHAETEPSETGETTNSESTVTESTFVPPLPWETEGTDTSSFSGDASVNNGSHSINAQMSVASVMDYAVKCKAALLYELDTETMVYSYNVDEKLYPASLTKVMTCLVALELCEDLNEVITVSEEIAANIDPNGSGMDLVAGEELKMIDLLYGLMVESANDAASVIAAHLAGSEEAFVRKMNQKASQLGCTMTHFNNVHGLHDEEHYTCARDMAKIMIAALENETFCELYSTSSYKVEATNKSEARQMYTTNYLISEALVQAYYDTRVIGGKTGFTTPAGRCLVTVSEDNGMRYLCVILGAEMEFAEDGWTVISYGSFEQTQGLLNYGFNNYMATQVLSSSQTLGQFDVEYGSADTQGMVLNTSDTVLPAGSDMSAIRYEYAMDQEVLTAPVQAGDPIGVVRVWYQTKCIAQQELYAASTVEKDVASTVTGGAVDPAAPVEEGVSLWHIILIIIVVLLGLIAAMLIAGYIRAAILRAKRAKRRRNRRRSR